MADTVHAYNCSGEHDDISGACVGFKEGDRVKYVIGMRGDAEVKTKAVHTISRILSDAKAVLVCDEGDGCFPMYGPESPVWLSRLRLEGYERLEDAIRNPVYVCGECGQQFTGKDAEARRDAHERGEDSSTENDLSDAAANAPRTILAHLNITLPATDTRTEAEITELLSGIIEVGNGQTAHGKRYIDSIEITLVEEV